MSKVEPVDHPADTRLGMIQESPIYELHQLLIEIDLLEMLGERSLPPPRQPTNNILM